MRHTRCKSIFQLLVISFTASLMVGCGINNIPSLDEEVSSAWAQVENQYQRRATWCPIWLKRYAGSPDRSRKPSLR
mgnify:CR=1 FL=1